jgi:hypothetical protein
LFTPKKFLFPFSNEGGKKKKKVQHTKSKATKTTLYPQIMSTNQRNAAAVLSMMATAMAFAPSTVMTTRPSSSGLSVAVDPTVASPKEYQDVCGNIFGEEEMKDRLKRTNYLYPKHVEVIEDLAEIAGSMTDKIVSVN